MIQSANGRPYNRSCQGLPPQGLGVLLGRVADQLRTTDLALLGPRLPRQAAGQRPELAP